jgi:glycosyltransferase involved in cell wall biosynthesis
MDISVVVPCYNNERYVRSCLGSLLAQSYPRDRYEVIFVDNRSTDRSAEIAREFRGVTVLEASKQGSYAARNVGVRTASARILAFTDSDCEVCPTWLEQIAAAMEDRETAVLLGARRFARETLILSTLADYEIEKARYVFSQNDASLYYAYTNNMAVPREAYERAGPFEEIARGADVIFVSRVLKARGCDAVTFRPELQVRHLEIDRWFDWHKKMFIYGRSYQKYRQLSRTRPLSYGNRLEILRRSARRNHYGLLRSGLMLASGIAATAAYAAGRRRGGQE